MRNICLSLMLVLGLACSAQAASVARIVAVVNGDMITARDLDKAVAPEIAVKKLNPANAGDAAQIDALKRQTLDAMINEKILMQEAEKQKITVPDELLDAEMERFVVDSQLPRDEFMRQLAQQGMTLDQLRNRVRNGLISQQLIGRMVFSKVVVTDKEIADYFNGHVSDMPSSQVRVALVIYPAGEDAAKWASLIDSGKESFEDVARKVSVGPNAQEGGDMGFMNLEDMAPALRQHIEGLKKGQVSPLFDMQVNKAQVRLVDTAAPAEPATDEKAQAQAVPDAETAARIEEILKRPRLEARFKEYTEQLRNKALVDIRY